MEYNLTFIMGLCKEWRNFSLMVKTQQSFNYFTLNDLYNLLKTHEAEVNEIAEESKISIGGPLALVSKVSGREAEKESVEKENSKDEGLIVNSNDEAIAFYSINRVKKFFKKSLMQSHKQLMEKETSLRRM